MVESLESDVPELDAEFGMKKDQILSKVASCTSDGASNATKTSNLVGEAKQRAINNILSMFASDSPEVGAICTEYHVLHCANHALNLLAGHSHSQVTSTIENAVYSISNMRIISASLSVRAGRKNAPGIYSGTHADNTAAALFSFQAPSNFAICWRAFNVSRAASGSLH